MIRLFVGVALCNDTRAELLALRERFRADERANAGDHNMMRHAVAARAPRAAGAENAIEVQKRGVSGFRGKERERERERLAQILTVDGRRTGGVAWVPSEKYHITLRFLGEVEEQKVALVQTAIDAAIAQLRVDAIGLAIQPRVQAFQASKNPRVIYAPVLAENPSDLEQLHLLASALERETNTALTWPKKHQPPFKPHVTLGRVPASVSNRDRTLLGKYIVDGLSDASAHHLLANSDKLQVRVSEIALFRSTVSLSGSIYNIVSRHSLARS
mmetsp:Transcript_12729/g.34232  ORF Transcript_12729/g.34232 Transcript_12729/m.34232 type:complete len:272 (+) Transcript_12729:60-875(+)|eukprot:CAMPEP_0185838564 /NCGR_PEP_ID=MMETSP1353-20130828/13249_1 /TAXON_ID=1077150 /ORGANISM="Erythrolobus australicus, Strain CCMP3124" /LENGTH=271 /DNA_ID=CAMNT_0028537639 /DNA_START=51 /DNA_END=866 /DNA_ORIENTATION=+